MECTRKYLPLLWVRVIGTVLGLGFQLVVEKQFISYICRWNFNVFRWRDKEKYDVQQLMFIGLCIIVIVEEWNTNLMSLAILFHFLCAQHDSDINISIIRSLRLCCWNTQRTENKTTDVVIHQHSRKLLKMDILMSETCWAHKKWNQIASDNLLCFSQQNEHHPKPVAPNLQHTTNWEQDDRCGNSTTQSQAPDDGYINVRNMLST